MKRIYTAVFRNWYPSYNWFGRDSGLVTEGLRSIGVDSKLVILDTPGMPQDERFLPASREQFCDPTFWNSLAVDAVVLQGGGEAATQPVTDAIKASTAKLIYRMDTDGVADPCVDPWLFFYSKWWSLANPVRFRYIIWEERAWQRDLAKGLASSSSPATLNSSLGKELFRYALAVVTRPVVAPATTILKLAFPAQLGAGRFANRLAKADLILVESRIAVARIQRLLQKAGKSDLMQRVVNLPIPIPQDDAIKDMSQKDNILITVGRLEDNQKDLKLWVKVVANFLLARPDYRAVVIGNGYRYVQHLIAKYAPTQRSRFLVIGRSPPENIRSWQTRAKIALCTSRGESMHIASAEAVCAGCSIVGPVAISSMQDYTSHDSGSVSLSRRVYDLFDALIAEANEWDSNRRNPATISAHFGSLLAPEQHAHRLCSFLTKAPFG